MSLFNGPRAAARNFAHLLGVATPPTAAAAAAVVAEDKPEAEVEEDPAPNPDPARAEAVQTDTDQESEDEWDDEKEEGEMRASSLAGRARARERDRCAAIFAEPAAALNPAMAAELAFNQTMPASKAIALLRTGTTAQPQRGGNLAQRMAATPTPAIGDAPQAEAGPQDAKAAARNLATQMHAAADKARGARR